MGGPGGRALLVAGACALLACNATLRGGLSQAEADQLAAALAGADIASSRNRQAGAGPGAFELQVASADVARALQLLEREQLPRAPHAGFAELLQPSGLVATPEQERARWSTATAGELARSLERFAGVLDARVHLVVPEPRALDVAPPPPKASVLLRRKAQTAPVEEAAVRTLVAGAVDGLVPERVSVVQIASERASTATAGLVQVGPIAVTRGTAPALKLVLGSALLLDALLAAALIWAWRTRRRWAD